MEDPNLIETPQSDEFQNLDGPRRDTRGYTVRNKNKKLSIQNNLLDFNATRENAMTIQKPSPTFRSRFN